jgi:hypothetical protein
MQHHKAVNRCGLSLTHWHTLTAVGRHSAWVTTVTLIDCKPKHWTEVEIIIMLGDKNFIRTLKSFDFKAPTYRPTVILYFILSLSCLDRLQYYGRVTD